MGYFLLLFLYILLQWPESLLTWDILFLVPVPWTGPVIAPCLVSLGMILFGFIIIYFVEKQSSIKIKKLSWVILLSGVVIILLSFMWDYFKVTNESAQASWSLTSEQALFEEIKTYVPKQFNWLLFIAGQWICGAGMIITYRDFKKQTINQ